MALHLSDVRTPATEAYKLASGKYSLGDGHNVQIINANMEEAGRAKGNDRRTDVAVRDDLYPKDIGDGPSVTTIDQILHKV